MAIGLSNQIEFVTINHFKVMQFDHKSVVLDALYTDHDKVFFSYTDDFRVDYVLAARLIIATLETRLEINFIVLQFSH